MSFFNKKTLLTSMGIAVLGGLIICSPDFAQAATTGTSMPYDSALTKIHRSIINYVVPIAIAIAIASAIIAYMHSGESDDTKSLIRKLFIFTFAGAVAIGADKWIVSVFDSGAMIAAPPGQTQPQQHAAKTAKAPL